MSEVLLIMLLHFMASIPNLEDLSDLKKSHIRFLVTGTMEGLEPMFLYEASLQGVLTLTVDSVREDCSAAVEEL